MSHRTSVHDLKGLVLSFHSLIGVETVEEDRVRSLLIEVATDLKLPFYEWSLTSGFNRLRGATINGTQDALTALHARARRVRRDFLQRRLQPPRVGELP